MSGRKPKVEIRPYGYSSAECFDWLLHYGEGSTLESDGIALTREEAIADFEKLINAVAEIARDQGRYDG